MSLICVALLAAFSFVGCVNEIAEPQGEQQVPELVKLKLDISRASETKAVKSAWEEGDNIYLYFQEEGDILYNNTLTAVLTYNSGSWVVASLADQAQINKISQSGRVFAQYVAGPRREYALNGGSYPELEYGPVSSYSQAFGEIQNGANSYTLEAGVVSATLNLSQVCTQITVTGLDASEGWVMESPNTEEYTKFNGVYKYVVSSIEALSNMVGAEFIGFDSPKMYGVANPDGAAFYAYSITNAEQPVKIIINKEGAPYGYCKTFGGKQLQLGKAYKLKGPEFDESGNLTNANGWETTIADNKILFSLTAPNAPFPIIGTTAEIFGANIVNSTYYEAQGYGEIFFDGTVTKIGTDAFRGNTSLTSIVLPSGVTAIEANAFMDCTNLSSVNLPNSLTSIGDRAFGSCSSLKSLAIPNSVTTIGDFAFFESIEKNKILFTRAGSEELKKAVNKTAAEYWGANLLEAKYYEVYSFGEILFDGPVTKIGYGVFAFLNYFESITIPSGVTTIEKSAFSNCRNLTSITIPESVTSIGNYAFEGCSSLINVTIPDINAISIGENAFSGTPWGENNPESGLWCDNNVVRGYIGEMPENTSITIPDGMTSIAAGAFRNQTNLVSVTIPASVTIIGANAFNGCSSLTSVSLPNNEISIGIKAFYGTPWWVNKPGSGLWCDRDNIVRGYVGEMPENYSIIIPEGMSSIAYNAFINQANLVSVTIPETVTSIGSHAFNSCINLISVNIPSGVTTIYNSTFRECSSLSSITIPANVTSIRNEAFWNCSSLSTIYCKASTPPELGKYVFDDIHNNAIIYVPRASLEAYKTAWSGYEALIQPFDF